MSGKQEKMGAATAAVVKSNRDEGKRCDFPDDSNVFYKPPCPVHGYNQAACAKEKGWRF